MYRFFFFVMLVLALTACAPSYTTRVIEPPPDRLPADRPLKPWEKPYEVNGQRYHPLRQEEHAGFAEEGLASWYGKDFHGRKTSNGEIYDMYARTAAHKTLPLGVHVKVKNLSNGRETIARINDRGPFVKGRVIDLSYTLANELGVVGPGTAPVRIEALGYRVTDSSGRVAYQAPQSYMVDSYGVQVGAFTVQENARRLAGELKSRYGHASIQEGWVAGRLFYRVRAGKYPTLAAAETAKIEFERAGYGSSFVVALE